MHAQSENKFQNLVLVDGQRKVTDIKGRRGWMSSGRKRGLKRTLRIRGKEATYLRTFGTGRSIPRDRPTSPRKEA